MERLRRAFDERRGITTAVVVAVALLLVFAAVLLAVNVLSPGTPVAETSPSAQPSAPSSEAPSDEASASPAPSARPSAPPEATVAYGEVFAVESRVDDLQVRSEPVSGEAVSAMDAGDVWLLFDRAQTVDGTDWHPVQRGELFGWVSAGPAEDPYLTLHRRVVAVHPARVEGVAAGPSGFLAWGVGAHRSDEAGRPFVTTSAAGLDWTPAVAQPDAELPYGVVTAAEGPAGWLLVRSNIENTGLGGSWRSSDGRSWAPVTPVRSDGGRSFDALVPVELIGFDTGYALVVREDATGTSRHRVLVSPDGVSWREQPVPIDSANVRLARIGAGFMAYSDASEGDLFLRHAPDLESWLDPSALGRPPTGYQPMLAEVNGTIVVGTTDLGTSERTWWTATLPSPADPSWPGLTFEPQPAIADALSDTVVTTLVSNGDVLLALGLSPTDGSHHAWRSTDGTTWTAIDAGPLDEAHAETIAAGGEHGVIVLGSATTDAGPNPRLLHSLDGTSWIADDGSAIGTVASSVPEDCPPVPATAVVWMAIPGAVGAECFADEPITFRAWLTIGGGCGGFSPGTYEPGWLASVFATGAVIVTPSEAEFGGCGSAAVPPDVPVPSPQRWVSITGHWADPASSSCRYLPDPTAPFGGIAPDMTFACRTKFVATDVTEAP